MKRRPSTDVPNTNVSTNTRIFRLVGGELRIEADNLFRVTKDDRGLVFGILDQLIDYEESAETEGPTEVEDEP